MIRQPEQLEARTWDVLIVGAGITGSCLAFDAATRGMAVALIDRGDFGAETSAASSKLLHGGLRYLQQLRFGKLRESAIERLHLQNLAPHLTRWVPFVVPTYRGLARGKLLLGAGMALYQALCLGQNGVVWDRGKRVPGGGWLSPREVRDLVPGFDPPGLTGGRLFHECHVHSTERMTLAFVEGAVREGAVAVNYVRADDFLMDGDRVSGVRATDLAGGGSCEVRARIVVNAAGPWIRSLNERLAGGTSTLITGLSRGAHIVTRALTQECAVALPTTRRNRTVIDRGGRHVFVIPWRGRSLIGTTYAPHAGSPDEVRATGDDVAQLLDDINGALGAGTLARDDVRFAYAGLYPLTDAEIRADVYQGTGDYRVIDHGSADGVPGLLSVFGAKYTTARLLAERAADRIAELLGGAFGDCRTRAVALPAGEINDLEAYRAARRRELRDELEVEVVDHLVADHGRRLDPVLALVRGDRSLGARLTPELPVLGAQLVHAAREEMVVHLDDAVFRRTGLGTLGDPGAEALRRAADLVGVELGWDAARRAEELARVRERFPA